MKVYPWEYQWEQLSLTSDGSIVVLSNLYGCTSEEKMKKGRINSLICIVQVIPK